MTIHKNYKILLFRYYPFKISYSQDFVRAAEKFGLYPPLGLALISAVLKKDGYSVKVVDAFASGLNEEAFLNIIDDFKPNAVGCTLWTPNLEGDIDILEKIKKRYPGITAVVGGPHVELYPEEVLKHYNFIDIGVIGEGEETAIDLFEVLSSSNLNNLKNVDGIIYRDIESSRIIKNKERALLYELDKIPFPDFSELPINNYYSVLERTPPFIYLYTTRGCPYKCRYCVRNKSSRSHSLDYVFNLIKYLLHEYPVKEIHFYDETFTMSKQRTLEFCRRLKDEQLKINYTIRTRVDRVDDEILSALKETGCFRISFGIESGSQDILDLMNRMIKLDQARTAIKLAKKYKFEISTNFMIGYLNESYETYKKTVDFILELDPDYVSINITTILPFTELYYTALEKGILEKDVWHDYAIGNIDKININLLRIPGKDYSIKDLEKMLSRAYMRFYFRPKYILRTLRKVQNFKQFRRYCLMAWAMFINYIEKITGKSK